MKETPRERFRPWAECGKRQIRFRSFGFSNLEGHPLIRPQPERAAAAVCLLSSRASREDGRELGSPARWANIWNEPN